MPLNNIRKQISIKSIIVMVFLGAMLLSLTGIGSMIFLRWLSSAEQITESISDDLSDSIYSQISAFIHVPAHINESNYRIIQNGILDVSDEELRDKFFAGVLSAQHSEIYSFSYGTVDGEYYGARRTDNGEIEIMRSNEETGGSSWYYAVKEDLTAGELTVTAGPFDPRTRAWYQAAEAAGGPVFSPVYKHFVMDDLAVSAAWPVYDNTGALLGVLGTHMLLSDIGGFLKDTVTEYTGSAIILEKNSGFLIANSMESDNFTVLSDGTLDRQNIGDLENPDIFKAYQIYTKSGKPHFVYSGDQEKLFVNIREIHMQGIDWVVITAVPETLYMEPVVESFHLTALFVFLALALSLIVYKLVTDRLLKPMERLLQVSASLSAGDLSKRVEIARNDEIGGISESLNQVADKMQFLINNLEDNVTERTDALSRANLALEESRKELHLLINSTAEGIYGIDLNGECTFCNESCLNLLGYGSKEDLLGKNMHRMIHHSRRDGTFFPDEECRIYLSIWEGKGYTADDEVFWRVDGAPIDVEYHAYPQIRNGQVVGGVITFMDITERKKKEEEISYLSCHDTLTGLYNRRCFETHRAAADIPDNLPLSVIFADINGLKMTNDIFGHAAGDELIKKSSEILMRSCREKDIVARIGGDEFVILLPKTSKEKAGRVLQRIRSEFADARVAAVKCSISLGLFTKTKAGQPLEEILSSAENAMYKDKTMNRKSVHADLLDAIVDALHAKSPEEKRHAIAVSELCGKLGAVLQLSEPNIDKLRRAGYLHDIGKITLDERILSKQNLTEEEQEQMRQHSVVGYRILNLFDDKLDLAEYVYNHHERWDGEGYPRGLKGEQIPLISRVISITETFDRVLCRGNQKADEREKTALHVIEEGAGNRFDPEIAGLFVQMIRNKPESGQG